MEVTRMLRPLSILAALGMVLAGLALVTDRPVNALAPPEIFLPDYAARLDAVARLEITQGLGMSGEMKMSFSRDGNGDGARWQVLQRQNYPANQELVNETLLALANLQVLEARTGQPDWHGALGLRVPEALGRGIRFRALNGEGEEIVSLILGDEEKSEAEAVQQTGSIGLALRNFYVRKEAEVQSWLARGRLPRNPQIAAWLDAAMPVGDTGLLVQVSDGEGRLFARDAGADWDAAAQAWQIGFAALRPEDVTQADIIDFARAVPLELVYDNGLVVTCQIVGAGTVIWLRADISLRAGADAAARAEASALKARFAGWALRFPASANGVLMPFRATMSNADTNNAETD